MTKAYIYMTFICCALLSGLSTADATSIDFTSVPLKQDGIREGLTPSGTAFDFEEDSANFYESTTFDALGDNHWTVSCKSDAMTDVRICEAYDDSADLFFRTSGSPAGQTLCVFHHDFPGRDAQLRVGNGKPISSESGCFDRGSSAAVIRKMTVGAEIRTRYWKWPDDYSVDEDYQVTTTFSDLLSWITFWYAGSTHKLSWTAPASSATTPSNQ